MNNISNLFENLMTYNEVNKSKKTIKRIDESDSTLLNLTVELPNDTEDINPEDVRVDVGVMNVDTTDVETEESESETESESDTEDETKGIDDVTPEDETETEPVEDEAPEDKEESLKLRKEAIRRKRLEAKQLKETNKNKECTSKEDCECEACKVKKESALLKEGKHVYSVFPVKDGEHFAPIRIKAKDEKDAIAQAKKQNSKYKDYEWECELIEAADVETAKANIRKRVAANIPTEECMKKDIKKESLMHLDTKSLNKLFTEFVKENYKNIDKVVITKAMLENRMLKVEGTITNISGETTNITLTNRGFNPAKLENKRFIMDFKDTSNTFNMVKESLKSPFIFTCTLTEGVLKFEELKYSFKTMCESKVTNVSGSCALNESATIITEDTNQVKKFNEIVDKIKVAKTANDLTACKDEMAKANLGDTLLAAAQLVWDDVNSRMRVQ